MKVLNVSGGQDTGGQGYRLKKAFDAHSDWEYRSMVATKTFYPIDLLHKRRTYFDFYKWADVIHARNSFAVYDSAARRYGRKPVVVHYHGTAFRGDPARYIEAQLAHGAQGLVSTLDLWLLAPEHTEWLPAPYDVDWLQGLRNHHGTDRIVIAHAPTNREVKSTRPFLEAIQRLKDDGYPVELELIERAPWDECLERKARADIFFDQTILGYGCNALEAWGMGIPVVAGGADATLDEMERRFGHLPFYHATEDTIYDALLELVESPELRDQYGQIGYEYMRTYHDEPVVVEQLKGIYMRAMGTQERAA